MEVVFRHVDARRLEAMASRPPLPWALLRQRIRIERGRLARGFERLLALDELDIQLYDHQRNAIRRVLQDMRGRALLADEVGLGKTIEAGVVLKEYMVRGLVRKALVLAPATLTEQWRRELLDKLRIDARLLAADDDPAADGCFIASLDTAKRSDHAARLHAVAWDAVIVDEAHRLKNRDTEAWRFVDGLRTKYLLLLTATPIQNDLEELYNMMTLLKPGVLETYSAFRHRFMLGRRWPRQVERLREYVGEVMIRATKRDCSVAFPKRVVRSVPVRLNPSEMRFYTDVLDFARRAYAHGGQANVLPLILLLRELCSSPLAARRTLLELGAADGLTSALRREAVDLARRAETLAEDAAKLHAALRVIKGHGEPVVVFTEFLATQDALCRALSARGVPVERFHGGMSGEERRGAVEAFRRHGGVLVSTEAGGEGQNWQFCSAVMNYDLPWNPMRVEQRIGRVHRLGQSRDVLVINMYTQDTIEAHVYRLLHEKIRLFEQVIGDVDQILSSDEEETSLETVVGRLILDAPSERSLNDTFADLGRRLARTRRRRAAARERDRFRLVPPGEERPAAEKPARGPVRGNVTRAAADAEVPFRNPGALARLLHPLCADLNFVVGVLTGDATLHPALAPLTELLAGLRFANVQARPPVKRLVHHRHLLMWFKISHRSDETREHLRAVLVNPVTERVRTAPDLDDAVDVAWSGGRSEGTGEDAYVLKRLYHSACRHVQRAATRWGRECRAEARARLARERARLETYYEGLREEVLTPLTRDARRLEAARLEETLRLAVSADRDFPGSWTEQWLRLEEQAARALRALDDEKGRRLEELKRKYEVRAEVTPLAAAWLWTPMVECRVKLPGAARREMVFYYDPLQRAALDLACDGCGAPLHTVYQCGEGDLVCPDCFAPCTACSAPMCRACVVRRCHVCDGPLCGGCDAACPAGAFGLHADLHVCPTCRDAACPTCASTGRFLVG